MAKLQKRRKKGAVPSLEEASNNLSPTTEPALVPQPVQTSKLAKPKKKKEVLIPLNFKVSADFKKAYKQFALDNDMSLVEVLRQSFRLLKKSK